MKILANQGKSLFLFLGQTTFQSWPPKQVAELSSSLIQNNSLAHLNSNPPTRPSSTASCRTALPSRLAPLPHILLSFMPWKPRPSSLFKSPTLKLSLWSNHFAIENRWVVSLLSVYHLFSFLAFSALCTFCFPQISAGHTHSPPSTPFK